MFSQVEARCTPRAPLPVPEQGALPLPSGLPTLQAAFEPRGIEDLNAVIPEGAPKIAAAPPPEAPVCTMASMSTCHEGFGRGFGLLCASVSCSPTELSRIQASDVHAVPAAHVQHICS